MMAQIFAALNLATGIILVLWLSTCRPPDHSGRNHSQTKDLGSNGLKRYHNRSSSLYTSGFALDRALTVCPDTDDAINTWKGWQGFDKTKKDFWLSKFEKKQSPGEYLTVKESYLICMFSSRSRYTRESCAQIIGCHVEVASLEKCEQYYERAYEISEHKIDHKIAERNDPTSEKNEAICDIIFGISRVD